MTQNKNSIFSLTGLAVAMGLYAETAEAQEDNDFLAGKYIETLFTNFLS